MDIHFYNNQSPHNKVGKILLNDTIISGNLKDEINIITPSITMSNRVLFNYCYIPILSRYYFITSQEVIAHGLFKINLKLDVLETYKDCIRQSEGEVIISESCHNKYMERNINHDVRLLRREKLKFNSPFKKEGENILLTIKTK